MSKMVEQPDKWRVFYYSDDEGHVPVREWLETLDDTAVARIFRAIDLLREHGVNLGTDYSRQVRGKIFELRVRSANQSLRILYVAVIGRKFVLLHAFGKRSRKTPAREIEIAEQRLADYQRRSGGT